MYKYITLPSYKKLYGIVNIHGSKSISNRSILIASIARGTSILNNFLFSDDTIYLQKALSSLGICFDIDYSACKIKICNKNIKLFSNLNFYLGNSATAFRFLLTFLFLYNGIFTLNCDLAMKRRPILNLVNALYNLGCNVEYLGVCGYPPVRIYSKGFVIGKSIFLDSNLSSQYLSSLLLGAPYFVNGISIYVTKSISSRPYVDLTKKVMLDFGVSCSEDSDGVFSVSSSYYQKRNYFIEGDVSNALYFFAMALVTGGSICVNNLNPNTSQGDILCLEVLKKMGAIVSIKNNSIRVSGSISYPIDMDFNHIPDCVPVIAVLALFAKGVSVIRNIFHIRFKETDRLSALVSQLRRLGAGVIEKKDAVYISPARKYRATEIYTYEDHRMIMAFSIAALRIRGLKILGIQYVSKSFPDYFKIFDDLCYGY